MSLEFHTGNEQFYTMLLHLTSEFVCFKYLILSCSFILTYYTVTILCHDMYLSLYFTSFTTNYYQTKMKVGILVDFEKSKTTNISVETIVRRNRIEMFDENNTRDNTATI